jgi:hypothetical protein
MIAAHVRPLVRPLSVGEIFDRSITFFFARWRLWVAMFALGAVSSMMSAYFRAMHVLAAHPEFAQARHASPPGFLTAVSSFYGMSVRPTPTEAIVGFIGGIAMWMAAAAVGFAVWRVYRGEEPGFRECAARVATKVLPMVGVTFAFGILSAAVFLIGLIPFGGLSALASAGPALYIIPFLTLPLTGPIDLSSGCGIIAVLVEKMGAREAIRISARRVFEFEGGRYWRSLGVSLGLLIVSFASGDASRYAGAAFAVLTLSPIASAVVAATVSAPFLAYSAIITAIYYLDARIRTGDLSI